MLDGPLAYSYSHLRTEKWQKKEVAGSLRTPIHNLLLLPKSSYKKELHKEAGRKQGWAGRLSCAEVTVGLRPPPPSLGTSHHPQQQQQQQLSGGGAARQGFTSGQVARGLLARAHLAFVATLLPSAACTYMCTHRRAQTHTYTLAWMCSCA